MLLTKQLFARVRCIFKGGLQLKADANGGGRKRARRQSRAKLIEQPPEKKRKRIEFLNGIVQLQLFFEETLLFRNYERARACAPRQRVQANSFLSEAFGELQNRQFGKSAARVDAPAVQRFSSFRGRKENIDRQLAQIFRFPSGRNHRGPGETTRSNQGRFDIRGDSDIRQQAAFGRALHEVRGDGFCRRE